jgi:hypothetical protein
MINYLFLHTVRPSHLVTLLGLPLLLMTGVAACQAFGESPGYTVSSDSALDNPVFESGRQGAIQ